MASAQILDSSRFAAHGNLTLRVMGGKSGKIAARSGKVDGKNGKGHCRIYAVTPTVVMG